MSGFKKAAPVFNTEFGLVYRYNGGRTVQRCHNCNGILTLSRKKGLWNCGKCGTITNMVYWSTDGVGENA